MTALLTAATAAALAAPGTEALVRGYFEMWNAQDPARAEAVVAPALVGHVNADRFEGIDVLRRRVEGLDDRYTSASFVVEDLLVDGDRAVARWTFRGAPRDAAAPAREIRVTGTNWFRVESGRIAELWVNADDLGELVQLGVVTLPR